MRTDGETDGDWNVWLGMRGAAWLRGHRGVKWRSRFVPERNGVSFRYYYDEGQAAFGGIVLVTVT